MIFVYLIHDCLLLSFRGGKLLFPCGMVVLVGAEMSFSAY